MSLEVNMFDRFSRSFRYQRGQSLAETAIFLPILFLLIAGVVEVSNLLATQNRVTTATRSATSFGAANYTGDEWTDNSDWATTMSNVALNNVTATLDLDPALWDIWAIKMTVDITGTGFEQWLPVHGFGGNQTVEASEWATLEPAIQQNVLDQLQADGYETAGLDLVATVSYHQRKSLLGMNFFNVGSFNRIQSLIVMRVDEVPPYLGCDLLPIAIRWQENYSLYPSNWAGGQLNSAQYPNDPVDLFPTAWDDHSPTPSYTVPLPALFQNPSSYLSNLPGVPLEYARPGYLYWARDISNQGNFGWLDWDAPPASATDLEGSLVYPGDFWELYPGSGMDLGTSADCPSDPNEVCGDGDGALELNEWVHGSSGNVSAMDEVLEDNVMGRTTRLIVYNQEEGTGLNKVFKVKGFVLIKMVGWRMTTSDKWMVFEFVRWDNNCGAPQLP